MTGKELALAVGLKNIAYWKDKLIEAGHTTKSKTGRIEYKDSAVEWLKNRPKNINKTQGGGELRKRKIFESLVMHGWVVHDVWYSVVRAPEKGWYYTSYSGEKRFLGRNFQTALENIPYYNGL